MEIIPSIAEFDKQLIAILHEISQGPEIINSFSIESIVNLTYDYPSCLETLIHRLNEFINCATLPYLLSTLYLIDALIRYPSDEICLEIEKRMSDKIIEVVNRMSNSSSEVKEKLVVLLDHWQRHDAFKDLIGKCKRFFPHNAGCIICDTKYYRQSKKCYDCPTGCASCLSDKECID